MILEISCLISKKKIFILNFHFFKTGIFGCFLFLAKNTPKLQKLLNKTAKIIHLPYYLSHFIKKKIHFLTLTFFLRPFYMESPTSKIFCSKSTEVHRLPSYLTKYWGEKTIGIHRFQIKIFAFALQSLRWAPTIWKDSSSGIFQEMTL